jgi:tryptophan synthase alpha subunit
LQAAATRSLAQGTTLDKVLGMLKEVHMFLAKATVFGANNMMSKYYLRGMNMAYR